jgi:hypothetical protein
VHCEPAGSGQAVLTYLAPMSSAWPSATTES